MKTYIVYQDEHAVHLYNVTDNEFFDAPDIKSANLEKTDFIVCCNQEFVIRNKQIDVCVVEKMIYFPGPKNLQRLYQKYTHKSFEEENKIKPILKAIATVYKRQQPVIKELLLSKAVLLQSEIAGTIAYINSGKIQVKDDYIETHTKRRETMHFIGLMSREELIKHLTIIRYPHKDDLGVRFNLSHKNLLSVNDEKLNAHVAAEQARSEHLYYLQYAKSELNINHKSFGSVTGRITTSDPNIQGMDKSIIKGNIWSFDFTGFEIMIYLCLYKKGIMDDFIYSKKKDIYGFIFWELYPDKYGYDSDDFKTNHPEPRQMFKELCIKILYGATLKECQFFYGNKIDKIYKKIYDLFDVKRVQTELLEYACKSGRYLINKKYNISVSDQNANILARILPESKRIHIPENINAWSDAPENTVIKAGYHDIFTKERGILLETAEKMREVKKHVLNYNIQGTGALIIKIAVKYAIRSGIKSKILMLRHDEIIADIVLENDKREIVYAMEDACKEVILQYINIDMKQV